MVCVGMWVGRTRTHVHTRARTLRHARTGPTHPDTLTSVNNLAGLLQAQGKLDEAEPLYRRALAGREETLGACAYVCVCVACCVLRV